MRHADKYLFTIRQSRVSTGNVRRRLLRASSTSFPQITLKHSRIRHLYVHCPRTQKVSQDEAALNEYIVTANGHHSHRHSPHTYLYLTSSHTDNWEMNEKTLKITLISFDNPIVLFVRLQQVRITKFKLKLQVGTGNRIQHLAPNPHAHCSTAYILPNVSKRHSLDSAKRFATSVTLAGGTQSFTARQANVGRYWSDTTRLLKDPTTYTYRYFSSCMIVKVQDMGSSEVGMFFHQSRHVKTHQLDERHDALPCVTHNMAATKGQI